MLNMFGQTVHQVIRASNLKLEKQRVKRPATTLWFEQFGELSVTENKERSENAKKKEVTWSRVSQSVQLLRPNMS